MAVVTIFWKVNGYHASSIGSDKRPLSEDISNTYCNIAEPSQCRHLPEPVVKALGLTQCCTQKVSSANQ